MLPKAYFYCACTWLLITSWLATPENTPEIFPVIAGLTFAAAGVMVQRSKQDQAAKYQEIQANYRQAILENPQEEINRLQRDIHLLQLAKAKRSLDFPYLPDKKKT